MCLLFDLYKVFHILLCHQFSTVFTCIKNGEIGMPNFSTLAPSISSLVNDLILQLCEKDFTPL